MQMKTIKTNLLFVVLPSALCCNQPAACAGHYKNFQVAVYTRAQEVKEIADLRWLESKWAVIQKQLSVDKVYLETHRDGVMPDGETVDAAKLFFQGKGIRTAGGITLTVNERNRFQTFCYTNPEQRKKIKNIVEFTARHFDEIILDDFFFTNCKCRRCIKAKGDKSWTRFRLDLLTEAARDLIIGPARAINPKVRVVIKYPNWYEHFQGLGFNLETEPKLFDAIYTGTETRDPDRSSQHLQPYQGYEIFRYFENIKPGGNAGGWVDTGGLRDLDRYAEQIWLTLFAKAPEITLFDFRQMLVPLRKELRADWQGRGTSFDFDGMIAPVLRPDGTWTEETTMALAAGYALNQVDPILDKLGNPVGVKSYKPFHSTGEDFLHNYLGMAGIPMDLVPEFPTDASTIFLAETAKSDPSIVDKIKKQLADGKTVVITSGLLRALKDRGINDIVELRVSDRKALVKDFAAGYGNPVRSKKEIMIPQIQYLTNDSWEEVSALGDGIGWPILHSADYAKGKLYVLTVPDDFGDIYSLPPEVMTRIKETLMKDLYVRIDGPSKVALFVYDNNTFIAESFLPEEAQIRIVPDERFKSLRDDVTGEALTGKEIPGWRGMKSGKIGYDATLKPHSFRMFRCE
jgi:hypothetical protein